MWGFSGRLGAHEQHPLAGIGRPVAVSGRLRFRIDVHHRQARDTGNVCWMFADRHTENFSEVRP